MQSDSEDLESAGWYAFLEDSLASSAEEAQGYRVMHEKAHKHYSKISSRLTIPAIILSTLTGVANFGQESLEPYMGANVALYIGALSIVAAVFSTVAKYLRADEKSEMHRSAMVQWDKLLRMLVTVLSQPRSRRIDAQEFLLQYREERNRLSEQVPVIPYKIREWFLFHYGAQYSSQRIRKPGILAIFDVPVYRANEPRDPENGAPSAADLVGGALPPSPRKDRSPTSPGANAAAASKEEGTAEDARPAGKPVAGTPDRGVIDKPGVFDEAASRLASRSPGAGGGPISASPPSLGSLAARMSAGTSHFTAARPSAPQLALVARRLAATSASAPQLAAPSLREVASEAAKAAAGQAASEVVKEVTGRAVQELTGAAAREVRVAAQEAFSQLRLLNTTASGRFLAQPAAALDDARSTHSSTHRSTHSSSSMPDLAESADNVGEAAGQAGEDDAGTDGEARTEEI
jgi:hypothetical protein